MTTAATDLITGRNASHAMTLIGILKRPRAKALSPADPEHVAAAHRYLLLGDPSATAGDAVAALNIVKMPVKTATIGKIAQGFLR